MLRGDRRLILIKKCKVETSSFFCFDITYQEWRTTCNFFQSFDFTNRLSETSPAQLVRDSSLLLRFPQIPMYHKLPNNISLYECSLRNNNTIFKRKTLRNQFAAIYKFRALRLARQGSLKWASRLSKDLIFSHTDPFHSAGGNACWPQRY